MAKYIDLDKLLEMNDLALADSRKLYAFYPRLLHIMKYVHENVRYLAQKCAEEEDGLDIVHCKDCKHSYEDISSRICAYGPPVDCVVQENFYCANGEREEE